MEPPSPIQALEVNPFPSRFINIKRFPEEVSHADRGKRPAEAVGSMPTQIRDLSISLDEISY